MKNILISSQAILLAFIAFPTMFYTPNSESRISRGPAWVAAIDAVNNRRISPTTGVYDPNCDDAKLWDIKLVDKDGDGMPDEDRELSRFPSAGMVRLEDGRRSTSAFVVGRRHVVTVAHGLAKGGQFRPGHDRMYVEIEGCPGEKYEIVQKHLGTMSSDTPEERLKDYSVLELNRDVCGSVTPVMFGSVPEQTLNQMDIFATGYYSPESIGIIPDATTSTAGQTALEKNGPGTNYLQYTSTGKLRSSIKALGQRADSYVMGQSFGGSGGPILAFISGEMVAVGMQFYQPGDEVEANFNFSIASEGPFMEFVKTHVPDLRIYQHGTNL